jgi:hypothetical protein
MPRQVALHVTSGKAPLPLRITRGLLSSWDGPNFLVLVVHGVVPAKLAPRKSHGGRTPYRYASREVLLGPVEEA